VHLTGSNLLQLGQVAVEDIRISTIGVGVSVLPDGLEWPVTRDGSWGAAISGQHQGASGVECGAVASALAPPIRSAVDHGVTLGLGVVGIREVLDPGDHSRLAEAVAGSSRGVVLNIEHAGKSDSVAGPSTSVGEEVGGLGSTRAAVRVGEVVATTDEAGIRSTNVVAGEGRINVIGSLRSLDNYEAGTGVVGSLEIDIWLVAGDIEALDGGASLKVGRAGAGEAQRRGEGDSRYLHGEN
jgi:hypothetical protein